MTSEKPLVKPVKKMASHRFGDLNGSLSERQDSMFDRYLDEMKPYVLRLAQKSGITTVKFLEAKMFRRTLFHIALRTLVIVFSTRSNVNKVQLLGTGS